MRRSARDRLLRALGVHSLSFVISAGLFALPIVYLALQSFKSYTGFLQDPTGLPTTWTFSNFTSAWTEGNFGTELINSLIYAVIPDAVTLLLGVFLAFPISRGYFKFSNALYAFFVFSGFLPAGLIPLFVEARALHLYNSRIGYLVLTSFAGAGFFFFVGYIKSIPRELDEAAALEGCGYFRFIITHHHPADAPRARGVRRLRLRRELEQPHPAAGDAVGPGPVAGDPGPVRVPQPVLHAVAADRGRDGHRRRAGPRRVHPAAAAPGRGRRRRRGGRRPAHNRDWADNGHHVAGSEPVGQTRPQATGAITEPRHTEARSRESSQSTPDYRHLPQQTPVR